MQPAQVLGLYRPDIADWNSKVDEDAWGVNEEHMENGASTPAKFSVKSLTQLLRISNAFLAQHGRALQVVLTQDEYVKHLG